MLFRLYSFYFLEHYQLVIYLHTLSRLDALAMGAIGGYVYSVRPFKFKIPSLFRGILIAAFLVLMFTSPIHSWLNPFDSVFKKYIYLVIMAVLLLDFNFNPTFKHSLKGSRFLHYLGKISYGIYMYGNITILYVTQRIMHNNKMDNIFLYFAFIIIIPIIVATISYEFFEKPLLKLKRKFSKIKTAH
jgi:peptidoglycan/LPS O-acetylase OafA/YrhL